MSKPNNGWGGREREREREDCLARNTHSRLRPAPPTQVTSSRTRETISVFRSLPFPVTWGVPAEVILFNNPAATLLSWLAPTTTRQLPCNSVAQCQVMQPGILFLSISQYIHNSSSGRYNGFTETLDRGNPIMCSSQPTSIGWLALALRFGVT